VLISPLKAVSVLQQVDLIKLLLQKKGFQVEEKTTITVDDLRDKENYGFLWVTLATSRFLQDAVVPYLFAKRPKAIYVTIEGVPTKANLRYSNIPRLEFIANSNYTADCLKKAGLKVIDVVHHAIDIKQCYKIAREVKKDKEKLHEKYDNKCILVYVGRHDPRKKVDFLCVAHNILQVQGFHDYVLIVHSDDTVKALDWMGNVEFTSGFGTFTYRDVLKLIACADYLVFPSVCEGFGLPVLEAMALGVPVIHCWFPPLSEFSSQDFNFVFDYQEEKLVSQDNYQWWIFHLYDPMILAEMIKYAVETWKTDHEQYLEYCVKAYEHAKKWDYRKIYPKLLRHLKIK